ncbi:hypothetical protein EF294_08990 [Gordonia oryzae]|uniref:Uncharacterized protein n=1 Tax=Gordonia oryzae TaxID=2487349 RepID=A0A3N4GKP7_9ACTN|nr:hypothetical protein [Gordonia oryzae]RPA62158.1 hypothetical protein EF294_08990 [Gordonia oryzae]
MEHIASEAIDAAAGQLRKKAAENHAQVVFVVAHVLDYPTVEAFSSPLLAHHLPKPDLPTNVDALWMLFGESTALGSAERTLIGTDAQSPFQFQLEVADDSAPDCRKDDE